MSDTLSVLKQLTAAFPSSNIGKETIAVYVRMLSDISKNELQAVVDQCLVECRFLPTIAEIRERHRLLTRDLSIPTAEASWEEVRRSFGRTNRAPWSHPFVEEAVNIMGYRELCMSTNQGNDMVRFLRIYASIAERDAQIRRLTPTARQIAERSTALQPISAIIGKLSGEKHDSGQVN